MENNDNLSEQASLKRGCNFVTVLSNQKLFRNKLKSLYIQFFRYSARMIQTMIAFTGLILLFPIIICISLLIKLTSPGPILYKGERVGKDEKLFTIYKFRTLRLGAEEEIGDTLLTDNDNYFTKIGRFLRRTKLDEIPQLINVIKGNMNFVGPRPIRPIFLKEAKETIQGYDVRFRLKPGLTGLAQLRGDYYTTPRNKLRYETIYLQNHSILLDLKIIFLTLIKFSTSQINNPNRQEKKVVSETKNESSPLQAERYLTKEEE